MGVQTIDRQAGLATQPSPTTGEIEERTRIERSNEILLTSSSKLAATIEVTPHELAFTIVFYAMLLATICFLGVLVGIVSARLQGRASGLRTSRSSFRASVLVFGLGLSGLFCATVTIGVPTFTGFLVGLVGGGAIALSLFVRAIFLQ